MIWIIANNKTDKYINEEKEKDKIQSIIKLFDKKYNITVLNGLKNNPTILQVIYYYNNFNSLCLRILLSLQE